MDSHNIVSRCPSCGGCFLFIGKGGHLTCSLIGCDEPVFDRAVDNLRAEVERLKAENYNSSRTTHRPTTKLRTENKRLREALKGARDMIERHGGDAGFIKEVLKDSKGA